MERSPQSMRVGDTVLLYAAEANAMSFRAGQVSDVLEQCVVMQRDELSARFKFGYHLSVAPSTIL